MRVLILTLCVAILCAGCGGGSDGSAAPLGLSGPALPSAAPIATAAPSVIPSATAPAGATITIDAAHPLATITNEAIGMNMAAWFDVTQSGVANALQSAGMRMLRWPGGSQSDAYHWQTGALCGSGGYVNPNSTFDKFMTSVVEPLGASLSITVNYGTNAACNGGGDPAEAAGWVDYANNVKRYGVRYWSIGNEVYGSWEQDLHTRPHDPATYAAQVASGFYPQMKAKDPSIQIGVVLAASNDSNWNTTVLRNAKYDYVEYHWYAQAPGNENDTYLLTQAPLALRSELAAIRAAMNANGAGTLPLYIGEINSVYADPGKQTMSIVNGLFAGMASAEALNAGVRMTTWWLGFGGCGVGNQSASLYGWQNFGGYMLFSDGTPEYGCTTAQSTSLGTPFPAARALALVSKFAAAGNTMLPLTLPPSLGSIRAYAATQGAGYALLLFNLDQVSSASVSIALGGTTRAAFSGTAMVYGRAQYDDSKNGVWTAPQTQSLGALTLPAQLTLAPWSMTLVLLQ